ncbi:MAG: rubredoxin, partial [Desulfobacteraceae bacterium]|nr:rubredoxin [Desulfobacteraceae bacterium]
MKVWQCSVCKYIHRGDKPPDRCPICNVPASKFKEIKETKAPTKKPGASESGLEKIYSLLTKHHAHPVSVHTPNGILPVAVVLWIVAWIFSSNILTQAAFINLIFVVIALPFVIFTGVLEWKRKYNSALTKLFKIKILAATLTALLCA